MPRRERSLPERQALGILVSAIYKVARDHHAFSAADVWDQIGNEELRVACADSKLLAVALAKARKKGWARPFPNLFVKVAFGASNPAPRSLWQSFLFLPSRPLHAAA